MCRALPAHTLSCQALESPALIHHWGAHMKLKDWPKAYEAALASQDWAQVEPLFHEDACVTFSDGRRFEGRAAVAAAFEFNFSVIKEEQYEIVRVTWLIKKRNHAVFIFDYEWSGLIDGQPAQGAGRGTSVLEHIGKDWLLIAEHLSPRPQGWGDEDQ